MTLPSLPRLDRNWSFTLIIALLCLALLGIDLAPDSAAPATLHARALVTTVDNSRVRINLMVKTEDQFLTVRLLDGPCRGAEIPVTNMLLGKLEIDEFYEPGQTILVEYALHDGQPVNAMARGQYRLHLELLLILVFAGMLVALAGVTGLKAALSFLFSALVLWKLYFPLLLLGAPPVPTGLALVALLTAVITLAIGGLDRRGFVTFSGAMLGVLLTCALASWSSHAFGLNGAVRPFAETLLYSGYYHLDLTQIFIASIFIASSGAVMDLAMDIAASMDEIKRQNPGIGLWEHLGAGLTIGRAVIGTMTTTLLFAYASSHITMFLLFLAKGLPASNILNAPFVAAEVLNILVGSFGLITVAPFTVLVAGLAYRRADGSLPQQAVIHAQEGSDTIARADPAQAKAQN